MQKIAMVFWFIGMCLGGSLQTVEAGMGAKYRQLPEPERLIEIELRLYNAVTLPQLIPSAETPVPQTYFNELAGKNLTFDGSSHKYIFGWIRYRRIEDVWPLTVVKFSVESPNDPNLTNVLDTFKIQGVTHRKSYFLIPIPLSGGGKRDDEVILVGKILEAGGIPDAY